MQITITVTTDERASVTAPQTPPRQLPDIEERLAFASALARWRPW